MLSPNTFFVLEYRQVRELTDRMDPLCRHEIALLHERILHWKQYRLEFLSFKSLTWMEHYEFEHTIQFAINFGSVGRFGEDIIERYIQEAKREDKASVQITEKDKRMKNVVTRCQIASDIDYRN